MSDKQKAPKPQAQEVAVSKCPVEKCGKTSERLHFCGEHFDWFKSGLVNKRGERPTDFDKKFQLYLRKQRKAA
jgi:hypothetical protein